MVGLNHQIQVGLCNVLIAKNNEELQRIAAGHARCGIRSNTRPTFLLHYYDIILHFASCCYISLQRGRQRVYIRHGVHRTQLRPRHVDVACDVLSTSTYKQTCLLLFRVVRHIRSKYLSKDIVHALCRLKIDVRLRHISNIGGTTN